jgi:hypothetical protein
MNLVEKITPLTDSIANIIQNNIKNAVYARYYEECPYLIFAVYDAMHISILEEFKKL